MSGGLIFALGLSAILLVVALLMLFRTHSSSVNINLRSANGANGLAGSTLSLRCPKGKLINWETNTLVSNSVNPDGSIGGWSCDPMNFDGSFNPSTTLTAVSALPALADCQGTNSCTVTIPGDLTWAPGTGGSPAVIGSGPCGGPSTQLIATYICAASPT